MADPTDLPSRLRGALASLRRPSAGALVCAALFVLYAYRYHRFEGSLVNGDGHYSWIYARSLAFDGDLHFANDYALCGDFWNKGTEEGGGRPANPFYLGPALVWAPLLAVARRVVSVPVDATEAIRGGCDGPLARATFWVTPLFGALALWFGYRLARRYVSDAAAAAGVAVVGLGSTLLHFGSRNPSYSHVWTAAAAGLAAVTWARATEERERWGRWFVAGAAVGVATLMRMQAAALLAAPALSLFAWIAEDARARRLPRRPVLLGIVTLLGFASVAWIQLYVNKLLYGALWVIPYGRSYLHVGHGNPFLLLFAPNHGFLAWHPLMWLGTLGFGLMLWRRELRLGGLALLVPTLAELYVDSAAVWHGGASYGARRLTVLAPVYVATTALLLQWLWRHLSAAPWRVAVFAAVGWLAPWALVNIGGSDAVGDGRLAYEGPVYMPALYGQSATAALTDIYNRVGNPLVFPATMTFRARYGLPPTRFDLLAGGGMFAHNYRPVYSFGNDVIRFYDPFVASLLADGLTPSPEGATTRGGGGRFLIELAWPYVTHVQLDAAPVGDRPVVLTVACRSFFGFEKRFRVPITRAQRTTEVAVPAGMFDAGINEVILRAEGGEVTLREWLWIDRMEHDTSVK